MLRSVCVTVWLLGCVGADSSPLQAPQVDAGDPAQAPDGGAPGVDLDASAAPVDAAVERPQDPPIAPPIDPQVDPSLAGLRLNELVSANEGAAIDEEGQTEDYVELINLGPGVADLGTVVLTDNGGSYPLKARQLGVGERLLLWADGDTEVSSLHLPFRLSSAGETVVLSDDQGRPIDRATLPAMSDNEAYARYPDGTGPWMRCRYASPERENGTVCASQLSGGLSPVAHFSPYAFSEPFPAPDGGIALTELALRPAAYVELLNRSPASVSLSDFRLSVSPHRPGQAWPTLAEGTIIPLPATALAPDARVQVAVSETHVAALAADPAFEGVLTLFLADGTPVVRVDFMRWPMGAALAQVGDGAFHRFCASPTPTQGDACVPLKSRPVGDRVRALRTEGDLAALAEGGGSVGIRSAKAVVDLSAPGAVHFLRAADWPLHYTFVREVIEGLPRLDRCDPGQEAEFYAGWVAFSEREYFRTEGRSLLLGTLIEYPQAALTTLEYTPGDAITAAQMRDGLFTVAARTLTPQAIHLRPQGASQTDRMREIDGTAPIVASEAPFTDVIMQALTPGVAYGELRFVAADALADSSLGPRVVLITDDVPNDIPLVGGLITEAFQTPLSHVNVLSQGRGTPNLALREARTDARLAPWLGQLVRFEVSAGGFSLTQATAQEVEAFHTARGEQGPVLSPRSDLSVTGLQLLVDHSLASLPAIGAKAAQLAELQRIANGEFVTPGAPAAIPVAHGIAHLAASGGAARLAALSADPEFASNSAVRARGLAEVRKLVLEHPVDPELLAQVEAHLRANYGDSRARFRSSSNTEDLAGFSGAGLYTSVSGALNDPERPIADAIRTVWASLWNARAYDERSLARIDQSAVAMAILIHPAFPAEHANGVAISRNLWDPIYGDEYYLNAQAGEASVTNPAPGVSTDEILYGLAGYRAGPNYQSRSNLVRSKVMTDEELARVVRALRAVHDHFRPLLDPALEERWFAMEIEFKLIGDARQLLIKQARPHTFGAGFGDVPADCREFEP